MNSLQSPTLRLHGSNAPPHSWTRSPVQCRYENHVIVCVIRHALHHAASRNDVPFQREGCHLRRRGERNRIRHHRLPAAALLAVWKVNHAMNPTKSAAPIPKIHRVALVDNDPRALESLSLLIEAKVPRPTWCGRPLPATKRSNVARGTTTISTCLYWTCPWRACRGRPSAIGSVSWTGICRFWASPASPSTATVAG